MRRGRYRRLQGVVRTSWNTDVRANSLPSRLADHLNHRLQNGFREQLGIVLGAPTWDAPWRVRESAVREGVPLEVDGTVASAVEVDTDPFVYGIGVRLREDLVATIAIPRSELPFVRLALVTRTPAGT